jgi:proteasome lid subunit RPN8/RPN11
MKQHRPSRRRVRLPRRTATKPTLRFSPWAWAKLLYLRDCGATEVGGFGISSPEDLLFVEDFVLIRQYCSPVTVAFDDEAVAEFFDQQIDAGRRPEQFARIWIHTHPGDCPHPSSKDEETFTRVFGKSDWAVMAILACGGESFSRLSFHVGPGGSMTIPIEVDFQQPFSGTDRDTWHREYTANVAVDADFEADWFEEFPNPWSMESNVHHNSFLLERDRGEFDDRPIFTTSRPGTDSASAIDNGDGDRSWGDW